MAIHWQVKFRSLRANTLYTVNIYDSSYNGTPVQLTGAGQPFETQEDDTDDMFTPVRTQSGYLRIVDDGSINWESIMPSEETSRPVTVTEGNTELWRGYMQPQSFSGEFMEYAQVMEFPLVCQLSVLSCFDVSPSAYSTVNFGGILRYIFDKAGVWDYVYFNGSYAIDEWLYKVVNWSNFSDYDSDGTSRSRYNCMELLEEVCKFWGWTCRTYGRDIYFCAPDMQESWKRIQYNDLWDIEGGYSVQSEPYSWRSDASSFDKFASVDNSITYLRGIRKATVNASINPHGELLSLDLSEVEKAINAENGSVDHIEQGGIHYYTKIGLADGYSNSQYEVLLYWDQSVQRARFYLEDIFDGNPTYKHNYNWTCWFFVNDASSQNYTGSNEYAARFRIKDKVSVDHSIIAINGGTKSISNGRLTCRLRIGNRYWDGGMWTILPNTFEIQFGNEENPLQSEGMGAIISNRNLTSSWPSFDGHGIPVNDSLSGDMVFDIVDVYTSAESGQRAVRINDLTISLVRFNGYNDNSDKSENVYTVNLGSIFADDSNTDTIFATDNSNQPGLGIIMNPDGSYCTEVHYGGNYDRPEHGLAYRMAYFGSEVKRKYVLDLLYNEAGDMSPRTLLYVGSLLTYPVATSHNWRDDKIKLTAIEL